MVFGDKSKFAIEIDVQIIADERWIYGPFILWVQNHAIGDFEDPSVDLKGCFGWLKDFVLKPENRIDPYLYKLDKENLYSKKREAMDKDYGFLIDTRYKNAYYLFDISYIGMSSFNNVTMMLIENEEGSARFVWQQDDNPVQEAFSNMSEINRVIMEAIEYFEREICKL